MDEINSEIGKRLKQTRLIFNEGSKLSSEQFAYLLGETGDKIRNFELGRSAVPVRLLYNLYLRGINPIFIISGEGSMFADNPAGREFRQKIESKKKASGDVEIIYQAVVSPASAADSGAPVYKAAAGVIPKRKKQ